MHNRMVWLALACGTALPAGVAAAEPASRPNIVFILADDLGYADLGCYGQKLIKTPNLDRLAAEGLRFTDFYAGSALCNPSRGCLMLGQHTGRNGRTSNAHRPPRDEDVTVAEVLQQAGYVTGMVGKWALIDKDANGVGAPYKHGWDYYYGEPNQTVVHSYYLPHHWEFDRGGKVSGLTPDPAMRKLQIPGNADGKRGTYCHDLLTEKALAFLDAHGKGGKPFFLYVPYCIPHANYDPPTNAPYEKEPWDAKAKAVAAMITRMDRDIGVILDRLSKLGIDRDTLVIFSSDNGPNQIGKFNSSGGLRGNKGRLYEGGIRVPGIARWPGKVKAGSTSQAPLAFWDLLPTAAELAGVKPPAAIDGISFVPALLGQKQAEHEYLYWTLGGREAVRLGSWKAVRGENKNAHWELYDLRTDRAEMTDVAAAHAEIIARVKAIAAKAVAK